MELKGITAENAGALCGLYRTYQLKETQSEFARRHKISKAAISYFERGISLSLYTFLAYVSDGLETYMDKVNQDELKTVMEYNRVKKGNYLCKFPTRDI